MRERGEYGQEPQTALADRSRCGRGILMMGYPLSLIGVEVATVQAPRTRLFWCDCCGWVRRPGKKIRSVVLCDRCETGTRGRCCERREERMSRVQN